jgi:hypothetical protein
MSKDVHFFDKLYRKALRLERARFDRKIGLGAAVLDRAAGVIHGRGLGPSVVDFRLFRDAVMKHERARERCRRLVRLAAR